jgi:tetratricopeptide (TPR) repeat protein
MRFDEVAQRSGWHALAGIAACVLLGACANIGAGPEPAARPTSANPVPPVASAPATAPGAAGAAAELQGRPAAAAGAAAGPVTPVPAPIDPAVVRAFDDALKALQAGHTDDAEKRLRALTQTHPELGGPHANLGILYRHADKTAEAVHELELAVQSNPQQPIYWNQLGIAYREQGQFGKAREAYEKAIAVDPAYPASMLNLGILFDLYLWDSKRALEQYTRYLALMPNGDEKVGKWVADLNNRTRAKSATNAKEQP